MMLTVGDTAPPLTGSCKQSVDSDSCGKNGTLIPANLAGASLSLRISCGGTFTMTRIPVIVSAMHGTWTYPWAAGDLSLPGVYVVEARVTYSDGKVQTFGPAQFRVKPQIT